MSVYDVAIVGLGAMGSAAAWQIAARGRSVVGFDRFTPPHVFGSTHGRSRIIREAYFEHPLYVPLVQRAYALWADLEQLTGAALFHQTGGLMIGPREGSLVNGTRESATRHGLRYEEWDAAAVRRRSPALAPAEDMAAIWEPRAGMLLPERSVAAMLGEARRLGADLRVNAIVTGWSSHGDHIVAEVGEARIAARRLVLAAGPWIAGLTTGMELPLTLERAVQGWFTPRDAVVGAPAALPVFILEDASGHVCYGLPDIGDGVKLAEHHGGEPTTMDTIRREVDGADRKRLEGVARRWLPGVVPDLQDASTCVYTNTPDQHFIVDVHPAEPRVIVVSACSGHGFKFAPAIGEIVADMAMDRRPVFDTTPFSIARLS